MNRLPAKILIMSNALKILIPSAVSFILGILLTPLLTHYFYKYKMWRKVSRDNSVPSSCDFQKIHDQRCQQAEISTPRTGGMIVWLSVAVTIFVIWLLDTLIDSAITNKMYFISRNQTLLPFLTLILASLIGLGDDFVQIFSRGEWLKDPVKLRFIKVGIIVLLGLLIGWWFSAKLGINEIYIPWLGLVEIGVLFIPFFITVMLAVFSSSVIDGLDGLSGGVLASIFGAYAFIAFFNNQIDLAAFCAVITGGTLAFLWFNIPPARFYMGETGMIGLTVTISILAFLTNTVLLLPIIAFPLFITSLSNIIQMTSRKFGHGRKIFRVAPLHHHLEAIGWSKEKIVMRYWIISIVSAMLGVILSALN